MPLWCTWFIPLRSCSGLNGSRHSIDWRESIRQPQSDCDCLSSKMSTLTEASLRVKVISFLFCHHGPQTLSSLPYALRCIAARFQQQVHCPRYCMSKLTFTSLFVKSTFEAHFSPQADCMSVTNCEDPLTSLDAEDGFCHDSSSSSFFADYTRRS